MRTVAPPQRPVGSTPRATGPTAAAPRPPAPRARRSVGVSAAIVGAICIGVGVAPLAAQPAADASPAPAERLEPPSRPQAGAAPAWSADWIAAVRASQHARADAIAREARSRGDPYGAYLLGVASRDGLGAERDPARARELFAEAASLPAAATALAVMRVRGAGGPVDLEGAHQLLSRAAEAGSADALHQLSLLLADPRFERRDPGESFAAAHRAALLGHAAATGRVGAMVLRGEGVMRDPEKALGWLRRAADRGDLAATGLLGEVLVGGAAGERDPRRGEALLLRAAQAGHGGSMATLATLYAAGELLPRDYASAYSWVSIALARGHATPALRTLRDTVEARLPAERIAAIQASTRTWAPRRLDAPASPNGADDPRAGTGTAFFVSADGHALTNHHVVRGCKRLTTMNHGEATVVGEDADADLALVRVGTPPAHWAQFRDQGPRLGEPVFVFGYPLYGMLSTSGNFTSGLVSSLVGLRDDARRIQISAPIQPGNSGGPVLDRHGRVIAVTVSMLRADVLGSRSQPQNVNFAVDAAAARSLLRATGVAVEAADAGEPLPAEALAEHARGVSIVLRCQR
jgi:TPR repeat protein